MSSKTFHSIFAFTLAFMMGLVANWAMTRQYVSNYNRHGKCPSKVRKINVSVHSENIQREVTRPRQRCGAFDGEPEIRVRPVDTEQLPSESR